MSGRNSHKYTPLLKTAKVLKDPNCIDRVLGHFEFFGYRNSVSGPRRMFAAMYQTFFAGLFLIIALSLFLFLLRRVGLPVSTSITVSNSIEQSSFVALFIVLATTFGAIFWREQKDLHDKWQYLANLFNSVVQIDPPKAKSPMTKSYNKREHLTACLVHDILIMEMWAHRSFQSVFCEILERAILYSENYDIEKAESYINTVSTRGIKYQDAKNLVSEYIDHLVPASDRPNWYLNSQVGDRLKLLKQKA